MLFVLLVIAGFVLMEAVSYLAHRYVFHGALWRIHQTHHRGRKWFFGLVEANDLFTIFFGVLTAALINNSHEPWQDSYAYPLGLGISAYGLFYFIVHDLFTHRRFLPFASKNKLLAAIRAAHQTHHQSLNKEGIEPFGLFYFDYKKFAAKTDAKT